VSAAVKAKMLVAAFWILGMPLLSLSVVAGSRALAPGPAHTRAAWALLPLSGLMVSGFCLRALLRLDAGAGGAKFDRRWYGRYYVEAFTALIIYVVLAVAAVTFAPVVKTPGLRWILAAAPSLGLTLIVVSIVRWVRRADDYHRERLMASFSATAAVTLVWTSSYVFLEAMGLPRLDIYWIPIVMAGTWGVWMSGRALLGR